MTAGLLVPGEALGVSWPGDGLGRVPEFMQPSQGMATARPWPLHDFLALGALPSAVPCTRLHTRHLLRELALADLADSVELIVSELITNAIQASHAEMWADPIQLWLMSDTTQVLILVWDASPHPPMRMNATENVEKGPGTAPGRGRQCPVGLVLPTGRGREGRMGTGPPGLSLQFIHGRLAVELSAYQRAASETSQLRLGGPQGVIAPMLGLASEPARS
jgi:anti-sigma regulatory factor (Ser/Thr protein kinase)